MIDYDKIMNTIVTAGKKKKDIFSGDDYLKTNDIGNTIVGRFLPNLKDVENTVYEYFHHGWKSKLDTSGIFQLCPNTYGGKCPTCKASITGWKGADPVAKEQSKYIRRRQNWLANFYVIEDKKHPENNGKTKKIRFGKQINDKYKLATEGEDAAVYGSRILRLDDQGCNFRIRCEQNSESKEAWPTYTNSTFLPPSEIAGMTDEKIEEILEKVIDLKGLFESRTFEVLETELNKHFFSNDVGTPSQPQVESAEIDNSDDIPMGDATQTETKTPEPAKAAEPEAEVDLDAMLEELKGDA
jgi:hypothetical protein|tara:strand:+ start:6259 stop:7152 length:894 start_codon:yes stop_codon:yes gene_type:complete